ncbi:MAG: hypothetical protein KDC28_17615 [Saprospiraceae bacterium]|nr:hypothetical protein [Saprospiraceae bacterium]MCB9319389.1 hypothetical protein [Lewinellaceae bacterium]
MKYLIYALLFTFMTSLSCGVETVLIILPLLSANWCDAAQNCHVYEFRPGQEASDTQEKGTLGGIEYWIRNGKHFKRVTPPAEGDNFIVGTFDGLNIEFAVHKRLETRFEEYYVGSVEFQADGSKKMYLENTTTGETLTLLTPDKCSCQ